MFKKEIQAGLNQFQKSWKDDILAGFSVSLIALPLCLGIAIASGFPPIAGVFSAIVGGIFVSRFNGSWLTIAGPAAGLIVVNAHAIETLGGAWTATNPGGLAFALAAIVIAGGLIALMGFLKIGKFGDFFPAAAVHGMLAAIGIIIIVKQLFPALGVKSAGKELIEVIAEIPTAFKTMHVEVALVAFISILILTIHGRLKIKWLKKIPAPLLVILVTIPLAQLLQLDANLRVDLPAKITESIVFPDFSKIGTNVFWFAATTITLVSAIESVLSAIAVDQLDPQKRKADLNKDLVALGGGASFAGMIGGLPMISEIVRSSANIGYGAKSQWSNFFHGLFLLIFILILKPVIELIPLSALAGMLIFTGVRLASPKEFKHMWEIGKTEFFLFVITCVTVLATDLLIGIGVGILLNLIVLISKGQKIGNLFQVSAVVRKNELDLYEHLSFSNYLGLKKKILAYKTDRLILNFEHVNFIDHNVFHHLSEIREEWRREGRMLIFEHDHHLIPASEFPTAERKRGGYFNLKFSKRDQDLQKFALKNGYEYNAGSTFGYEFRNFKLLSNVTINKAHNLILSQSGFTVADVVAREQTNLEGGNVEFTAFILPKWDELPEFRMGNLSFFDSIQELFSPKDIRFASHDHFSDFYLLTSDFEQEVRSVFNDEVLDFLEENTDFKMEVNDHFILIFSEQRILNPAEIKRLIEFSEKLVTLLARTKKTDLSHTL